MLDVDCAVGYAPWLEDSDSSGYDIDQTGAKFVRDFVEAWVKVMIVDRFDLD